MNHTVLIMQNNLATQRSKLRSLELFLERLEQRLDRALVGNNILLPCGGLIQKILADVERAKRYCNRLLSRMNVVVMGRSFAHKAALINEIVKERMISDQSYHSLINREDIVATYTLSYDTSKRCDASPTDAQLEDIFEQLTTTHNHITAERDEILPENIEHSHIIYKVQCSTRVRVRVVFENDEDVQRILSQAEGAASARIHEVRNHRIFSQCLNLIMMKILARPTRSVHSVSISRGNRFSRSISTF